MKNFSVEKMPMMTSADAARDATVTSHKNSGVSLSLLFVLAKSRPFLLLLLLDSGKINYYWSNASFSQAPPIIDRMGNRADKFCQIRYTIWMHLGLKERKYEKQPGRLH